MNASKKNGTLDRNIKRTRQKKKQKNCSTQINEQRCFWTVQLDISANGLLEIVERKKSDKNMIYVSTDKLSQRAHKVKLTTN